MFLDSILNEGSMNITNYDLEPIVKSHYEGLSGMYSIIRESEQDFMKLERAVFQVDILTEGCLLRNDAEKAQLLQEGVVGDFFGKVVQYLKDLWKKLLGWFKNLFTGIETRTRDIVKVIDKYKEVFKNTDFDDFEYDGYKWTNFNIKVSDKISANAIKFININKTQAEGAKRASDKSNKSPGIRDKSDSFKEKVDKASDSIKTCSSEEINAMVYNGNTGDELSSSEITTEIKENTQGSQNSEKIKGFSVISPNEMINFIKAFKSNEVLTKSQTNTNKVLKDAIDAVSKIQKDVQQNKNAFSSGENGHTANSHYLKSVKNAAATCKGISTSYSTIMATCIELEQAKFNEYKKVISAAIRFGSKGKNKND